MGINVDFAQTLFVKRCTCVTALIHKQTGIRGGKCRCINTDTGIFILFFGSTHSCPCISKTKPMLTL